MLDHESLIKIAVCYPSLENEILNAKYWKNIKAYLDLKVITQEEFHLLIDSIQDNPLELLFNAELCKQNDTEFWKKLKTLNILQIFNIKNDMTINLICKNLVNLTYLKLEYGLLSNDHVKIISNSMKKLNSFSFSSKLEINNGIRTLLNNMKYLTVFGLRSKDISIM